ncbi:MAG: hypothetical protein WAW52_03620 [Methanothrix sp.]
MASECDVRKKTKNSFDLVPRRIHRLLKVLYRELCRIVVYAGGLLAQVDLCAADAIRLVPSTP